MINFFRKIRKRLADENRPIKYMRYAIGEIALVMIGILLALQVNNWNEARKEKGIEKEYLNSILLDLSSDMINFEEEVVRMGNSVKNHKMFIVMLYEKQETLDDVIELFSLMDVYTQHLTVQNPTYADLISAGDLNIFSNIDVKKSIMAYYKLYEETSINIKEYNLVSTEYMIEADRVAPNSAKFYNPEYFNSDMYIEKEWDYFNDPLSKEFLIFQSMQVLYLDRNQQHLDYLISLKENAITLIKIIEEELSKKPN